ncbi:hypothetical protein DIURU_000756 [Diutina rugosa]|uniref:Cytochrome c oxidase assembly protein n=1 Tax=Diutina rugosa TaxID=5481 RepID=A0A642V3D7_DIURU|nr:uncharacterized protein DIURU_000756 [Diutina rugosa]KAA8907072.1 hypothetical protein DIURU_000756 [Diutina rugosa]
MSTASKVTFAGSLVFAAGSFLFINWSQGLERQALRQGPIKDAARMEAKRTQKMVANEAEHREQMELRDKLIKIQPLSDEIIRGDEAPTPQLDQK